MRLTRADALRYRVHAQELDAAAGSVAADGVAVLALGVQDTGPDGARWALAVRGAAVDARHWPDELALAWTLRGAPHAYRRADLADVAHAARPWSDADAAKRVFDAARPLRAAGIGVLEALDTVATTMRDVVREPMDKGSLSTAMTARLPEPYLRDCRPCGATHMYEQPFRLAALQAGLELEPGTSPPVLRRIPGWSPPASDAGAGRPDLDLVRGAIRFLGPTTPAHVAGFLDAPVAQVRARWPEDVVTVEVDGEDRWLLAADAEAAPRRDEGARVVRLVGPYDLFLQARDRELLVPDAARRKELWPVLGRPGAVLVDGEVLGTWRPRAKGRTLGLALEPWAPWDAELRDAVGREHERLAAFRGVTAS